MEFMRLKKFNLLNLLIIIIPLKVFLLILLFVWVIKMLNIVLVIIIVDGAKVQENVFQVMNINLVKDIHVLQDIVIILFLDYTI
jgi:hypothetical protein